MIKTAVRLLSRITLSSEQQIQIYPKRLIRSQLGAGNQSRGQTQAACEFSIFDAKVLGMKISPEELLPEQLFERTRSWGSNTASAPAQLSIHEFVLYWMSSAVRIDENPALAVATLVANHLKLPLVVCQELSEGHPYASDRHFVFEMEGAREVQSALSGSNIHYIFNIHKQSEPPRIERLVKSAALVIVEDMPVPSEVTKKNEILSSVKDVWAVDTACILPMNVVGKAYTRAFSFRHATAKERTKRVKAEWQPFSKALLSAQSLIEYHKTQDPEDDCFSSIDLSNIDLRSYVMNLDIDHSIPPVTNSSGGSASGYARWEEFKEKRLQHYARDRNDPLLDPSSRLSPYLRLGQISPFRIAREAALSKASGAYKFLDELLIWRELAYCYCRFSFDQIDDLNTLKAIPDWARETLASHQSDSRKHLYSWASLARGKTESALWNEAQKSLILAGELHNNLRMTWGKAFIAWTYEAQDALNKMIDINHRFALDGNDPSSYGGLLWALGQFDRPFTPEKPVFGTVRPRPLEQHSRRLNVENYALSLRTNHQKRNRQMKVGVIGCGISGLICGQILQDQGYEVELFDKGLNVGGRVATRSTRELKDAQFDHGAQYFTAKSPLFKRHVLSWVEDGVAALWQGEIATLQNGSLTPQAGSHERYVGVPSMRSIAEYLSRDLTVKTKMRVNGLRTSSGKWIVSFDEESEEKEFDAIVLAIPPAQAADLLREKDSISETCESIKMAPCWATMLALPQRLDIRADGLFVKDSLLSWIARDSSKPGRAPGERWVLHASAEWSDVHIEEEATTIQRLMTAELFKVTGLKPIEPTFARSHRWRYAIPVDSERKQVLQSERGNLIVCGDYCHGARVEGAFLSGVEAAARLVYSST